MKTSIKDDAGKQASWNEEFILENVEKQIQFGETLVIESFDQDALSSDWLGATVPITIANLIISSDTVKHTLVLNDKKGTKTGDVNIITQYIWAQPPVVVEEKSADAIISDKLDKKSVLRLIIKEASFLKDSDFFGKQDPYIKFVYNGTELQTDVKDDAGKQAKWDETFGLSGIST